MVQSGIDSILSKQQKYGKLHHFAYDKQKAKVIFRSELAESVLWFSFSALFLSLAIYLSFFSGEGSYMVIICSIAICVFALLWGISEYRRFSQIQKWCAVLYEKAIVLCNIETGKEISVYEINQIKKVYFPYDRHVGKIKIFSVDHIGLLIEKSGRRYYAGISRKFIYSENLFIEALKKLIPEFVTGAVSWKEIRRDLYNINQHTIGKR